MTAEVAILNKQAVAMAADSAVTTGPNKIFNTVNKLFALSKHEPVGIMVYSSAEFMGVPVETMIKEFRRERGTTWHNGLNEYESDFDKYLREDTRLFPEAARIRACEGLVWNLANRVRGDSFKRLTRRGWPQPTTAQARTAVRRAVGQIWRALQRQKLLPKQPIAQARPLFEAALDDTVTQALNSLATDLPIEAAVRETFRRCAVEQFLREGPIERETGVVIAGFGHDDIFPRLRSFEFQASLFGIHKTDPGEKCDISSDNGSGILSFAQSEMVTTFLEGRDSRLDELLLSFMTEFFDRNARNVEQDPNTTVTAAERAAVAAQIRDIGQALTNEVQTRFEDLITKQFVEPTLAVVGAMPKEELALLAEALINLTALKRKASRDAETVAGPTDVAVISKGDGFIWIKRKHYFDPKLNPAFSRKYLMEAVNETTSPGP